MRCKVLSKADERHGRNLETGGGVKIYKDDGLLCWDGGYRASVVSNRGVVWNEFIGRNLFVRGALES